MCIIHGCGIFAEDGQRNEVAPMPVMASRLCQNDVSFLDHFASVAFYNLLALRHDIPTI